MDPRVQHIFENSLKLSLRIPDRLNAERLVPYPVCQRLFMRGLRPLTKLVLIVFFAARVRPNNARKTSGTQGTRAISAL